MTSHAEARLQDPQYTFACFGLVLCIPVLFVLLIVPPNICLGLSAHP